jgi:hypothetical protein
LHYILILAGTASVCYILFQEQRRKSNNSPATHAKRRQA